MAGPSKASIKVQTMTAKNSLLNGRTSYPVILQTVTVVSLFVGAFWVGIISPIDISIRQLEVEKLSIREHDEFKARIDQEMLLMQKAMEHILIESPGRKEDEAHWQNQTDRITALTDRLNELQKLVSGSYNIGDQVKNLQKQIDDLRSKPSASIQVTPTPQTSFH